MTSPVGSDAPQPWGDNPTPSDVGSGNTGQSSNTGPGWSAPSPGAQPLTDPRESSIWTRLRYRHFTPSGCGVNIPVPAHSASLFVAFARVEQDGNYGVSLDLTWATSWHIDIGDKLTTGFTVQFQNNPSTTGALCWSTYRSEDA